MTPSSANTVSDESTNSSPAYEGKVRTTKITIPSDLRFHSQALSVNVRNPCESPSPKSRRTSACETLAGLCHHTEVLRFIGTPCGISTRRKLENFNFNLSGSDPVVANRTGVILPYEFLLSTKKCVDVRNFL
jgi:hypothetical protein